MEILSIYHSKMKNKYVRVFHQTPAQAKAYVTFRLLETAKKFIPPAANPKRYEERTICVIVEYESGIRKKISVNTFFTNCRGTLKRWVLEKIRKTENEKIADIIFIH